MDRYDAGPLVAAWSGTYDLVVRLTPDVQIRADGVGFLAPRASNLTDSGRTQNRRVEVILTSTQ